MLGLILECLKSASKMKAIQKLKQNWKDRNIGNSHMINQRVSELFLQLFPEGGPTN